MSPGSKNSPIAEEPHHLASKAPTLWLRARIIQSIRQFFIGKGYLEIETPHLIPAPAPERHIDALEAGRQFLHTSPELCMKRLLAAGYKKIFQICRCFRQDERGERHIPEFTLLEWYRAGTDYQDLMDECEEMMIFVSGEIGMGKKVLYQGCEIDLKRPWERLSVTEAFERHTSVSMDKALRSDLFDELMVDKIEPRLGMSRPTFLYDYPASLAALARLKGNSPGLAERFELYIAGLEMANAFTELTDPLEQERRFREEQEKRRQMKKTVYPTPQKFLSTLCHMPDSAGIALGVDRLVMLFADKPSIDHVVSFTPEEL